VVGGHHEFLLLLEQDRALHQAVMGNEVMQNAASTLPTATASNCPAAKAPPLDVDTELAPEMPDKWQGQFIEPPPRNPILNLLA